jgi:hypothetical protein
MFVVASNANELCSFQFFPSPTTNAFASQQFSWLAPQGAEQGGKDEQRQSYPDFSFQTAPTTEEAVRTTTTFQQPPVAPGPLVRSASCIHPSSPLSPSRGFLSDFVEKRLLLA